MHKKGFGTIENVDKTERNNKQKTRRLKGHTGVEVLFVVLFKLLHFISHFYKPPFRLEIHINNLFKLQ
mgnify:CR=1 FL=1